MGDSYDWFCDPVMCLLARIQALEYESELLLTRFELLYYMHCEPAEAGQMTKGSTNTHRWMIWGEGLERGTSVELTSGE